MLEALNGGPENVGFVLQAIGGEASPSCPFAPAFELHSGPSPFQHSPGPEALLPYNQFGKSQD